MSGQVLQVNRQVQHRVQVWGFLHMKQVEARVQNRGVNHAKLECLTSKSLLTNYHSGHFARCLACRAALDVDDKSLEEAWLCAAYDRTNQDCSNRTLSEAHRRMSGTALWIHFSSEHLTGRLSLTLPGRQSVIDQIVRPRDSSITICLNHFEEFNGTDSGVQKVRHARGDFVSNF